MSKIAVHCAFSEMRKLKDIKPNKRNTNQHSPEQIDLIAHSLKQKGWRRPILIGSFTNTIIAGEGRYLAAKKLKLKEIPIDYQQFKSEIDEYEYLELDNNTTKHSKHDQFKFQQNIDDLKIEDINLKDFGIIEVKDIKVPLNDDHTNEAKPLNLSNQNNETIHPEVSPLVDNSPNEKEISEDDFNLVNKCPECGYEW